VGQVYLKLIARTARVWKDGVCIYTLTGHEAAVWGVAQGHEDNSYITASADKTIRIWNGGKHTRTIRGHTDVVRSLLALPFGFASCSNDRFD
jgi:phospholipase A-2-activating protein